MVMLQMWYSSMEGEWSYRGLIEGEWSCYGGGQFNRGSMIVREVVSLMEGEGLCYGGGQFNGRNMVMLQKWSL